jgi:hypothetical protein
MITMASVWGLGVAWLVAVGPSMHTRDRREQDEKGGAAHVLHQGAVGGGLAAGCGLMRLLFPKTSWLFLFFQ